MVSALAQKTQANRWAVYLPKGAVAVMIVAAFHKPDALRAVAKPGKYFVVEERPVDGDWEECGARQHFEIAGGAVG